MDRTLSPMEALTLLRTTRGGVVLAMRLCAAMGLTQRQTWLVLDDLGL